MAVTNAWHRISLELDVPRSADGHLLDVGLFFEGSATFYLDGVELSCPKRQFVNLLNLTFEEGESYRSLVTYVAP